VYNDDWGGIADGYTANASVALHDLNMNCLHAANVSSFCDEFSGLFIPPGFRDYLFKYTPTTGIWEQVGKTWRGNRTRHIVTMKGFYIVKGLGQTSDEALQQAKTRLQCHLARKSNAV
jgi:hypothetical protein